MKSKQNRRSAVGEDDLRGVSAAPGRFWIKSETTVRKFWLKICNKEDSDAGTRTRVAWVRARYPNQLDYIGGVPVTKSN